MTCVEINASEFDVRLANGQKIMVLLYADDI